MRERLDLEWTVGHTDAWAGEPERFVNATVPGAVQLDWARAEGWGDAHFGERFRGYHWMEDVHWVYRARLPEMDLPGDRRSYFVCGGTLRHVLPGSEADRMTLVLRSPGRSDCDSTYVLMYRPGEARQPGQIELTGARSE